MNGDGFQPAVQPPPPIQSVTVPPAQDTRTLELPSVYHRPPAARPPQSLAQGQGGPDIDSLLDAVAYQESGGEKDPSSARGKKGEFGKYQMLAGTAAQYGITPEALTHPEVQRRARAELEFLNGRAPGYEDFSRLRYSRMVIDETMRLYPPVWVI